MHPIKDYMSMMVYATSTAIADILKLLVGKTIYHVKNTAQFSKQLRDLQLKEKEIMNSHDVVSLFTNIPIDKAMAVIRKQLEHGKTPR